MKDFIVSKANLHQLMERLQDELKDQSSLSVTTKSPSIGKWGMTRIWRAWMTQTAKYMENEGLRIYVEDADGNRMDDGRPPSAEDAHEYFTRRYLGVDENGHRMTWSAGGDAPGRRANKGERYGAMCLHEQWAISRGIVLYNPQDGEYKQLMDQENQ